MPLTHVKNEYTIPRGRAYFDPYDANEELTGEIPFGNTPNTTLSISRESADHYSSETAASELDFTYEGRVDRTGALDVDNMSMQNYAWWLSGTKQAITQAATSVTGELRKVEPGRYYQLGAGVANPLGVRNVSAVTVKDEAGTDTYDAGVDYNVDLETGRVQIIEGGGIVAGKVQFGYTPVAGTFMRVKTGAKGQVMGALRIVADAAAGKNRDVYMPKVVLTPNGDLPLVTDSNDLVRLQFSMKVLKPANAEAIYADGRPVAA